MRLALMIEGQQGVGWEDWLALARACEEHGVETLFRSDHYLGTIGAAPQNSLDAWTTLGALAAATTRLRLGTLVSPVTFRHPSLLAKAAVTVDHVSRGRLEVGIGAGWMEAEHASYGFPFPETPVRVVMLAEQVEIVHRQWTEEAFDFAGDHYRLERCPGLPKPVQAPHPPLIVGGAARSGTLAPAVRFADEYNTTFAPPEDCRERRRRLDGACEAEGRDPRTIRFSLMTGCVVGRDPGELRERIRRRAELTGAGEGPDEYARKRAGHLVIGTVDEAAERLRRYEEAGVERVMLQHLDHSDLEMVEVIGRQLAPAVA